MATSLHYAMLTPNHMAMNAPNTSPVTWTPQGHPHSEQFDDIYHSVSGALPQAQHVFLNGCGLPEQWQQKPVVTILETGFGLGLNFLATWLCWKNNPGQCRRLHFVSVEAYPVSPQDIIQSVAHIPELQALGQRLAQQYPLPLPGLHRIEFDEGESGQIILTLAIGNAQELLKQLYLSADAIYLDGFSPAKNPDLWSPEIMKALARLAHPGTRIATWSVAGHVRRYLASAGFQTERRPGLPPKKECLTGSYQPHAISRRKPSTQAGITTEQREAIVIGAGIAGASACWSLARRGWKVRLIDRASGPAQGASGLPIGLGLPHISSDDALLSRLTRAGAAWMKYLITACKLPPAYWSDMPVEQTVECAEDARIPQSWGSLGQMLFSQATTDENQPCRRFHHGMRVEGPALINALLAHTPGIEYQWNTTVTALGRTQAGLWQLRDQHGQICAQSPHVVVAAAMGSLPLCKLENDRITPNRGQITLGLENAATPASLPNARTGNGHFLLPLRANAGWPWSMGSTFQHDCQTMDVLPASHQENFEKLRYLSPRTAQALQPQFEQQQLNAFVEVRCTSADHMPMVGAVPDWDALATLDARRVMNTEIPVLPGLYVLTALGSRGLSAGALCAELLASMMCREPWPLPQQLVQALLPARFTLRQKRQVTSADGAT